MSVRQVPRPVARPEARDEAPTAAAAAATLAVHRPLSAVLAAGRAHGRASAPTGEPLGDAMVGAHFDAPGVPFREVKLVFNAPHAEDGSGVDAAIETMQESLWPQLRAALFKLRDDADATAGLTGTYAYLKVAAPEPSSGLMTTGEDARFYLTPPGKTWLENPATVGDAMLSLGRRYSLLTDPKKKEFWKFIWYRRMERGSLPILYFDSATSACWDHPSDEAGDCGEA